MRTICCFLSNAIDKASPVFLVSLCCFSLLACTPNDQPRVYRLEGRTMGTTYHITAVLRGSQSVAENTLQMDVDKLLENVNQIMSTYIPDSELSMLNQLPVGQAIVVSQPLFDILEMSERVSVLSGSAFDVTVGPLVNLWGFGPKGLPTKKPSQQALMEARSRVGHQFVELDINKRQVSKRAEVYIDLSAIAKGYGADAIAVLFLRYGINDYMIELGGELAVAGKNPAGIPWRIGVEQPTLVQTGVVEAVSVPSGGIATSGDYRNYFELEGKRYSHTINPNTGVPIEHTLASVTVVAESAAMADALATAINVLGPEAGYELALKNKVAAYFIIRHENGFISKSSPEFEQYRVKL